MSLPPRIAIASRNDHKLLEIGRLCAGWAVTWLTIHDPGGPWPDVQETGDTYLENALIKARAVAAALGEPAIADDSGIEVDALGGKPGPRSARFAGEDATDQQNLRALVQAVAGVPSGGLSARYRCVAAIAWPNGREVHAEGVCEGSLVGKPRGAGGFGYDPIFVPVGLDETIAELSAEQKDRISHRGRAFRALREALEARAAPV
ncbi:MAG: RdgB/HAM1 family non-canonical purine NTP pyrophosphatase [Actinomycetota bacterium]